MGICATDLKFQVIRPVLQDLDDNSPEAEQLLLGIAATESGLGFQLAIQNTPDGKIPGLKTGLGLYQITPEQHHHLWDSWIAHQPSLASRVRGFASQRGFISNPDRELAGNLNYATAIAWLILKSRGLTLPQQASAQQLSQCWKAYWPGSANRSLEFFLERYRLFVQDDITNRVGNSTPVTPAPTVGEQAV